MKKVLATALAAVMALSLAAAAPAQAAFPEHDINCIVPFGAGGGTDNLARPLAAIAEKELGVSLVVDNMKGASGATGTQFVIDAGADGYTLLMTAENPAIYDALDVTTTTYDDLETILLIGDETVFLIAKKDSPYETPVDLVEDALAHPYQLTIPVSGNAGLSAISVALMNAALGAQMTMVPADGDADGMMQLLSGQVSYAVGKMTTIGDYYESGEIKVLAVFAKERLEKYPDIPAITEFYPEFEEYLPWGSFYTVCAPQGTPEEALQVLSDAFMKAYENEELQTYMTDHAIRPLGYTGEEAAEYVKNYRKAVVGALVKSGTITHTLEELGIEE